MSPTDDPKPAPRSSGLRILHICRRYAPFMGGTERYVRDLASAQVRDGNHVTVLTLDRDIAGDRTAHLPTSEILDQVRVRRIPGWGTRRSAVTFRPDLLARAVRAHDVVHLHDLRFHVGLVALTARAFGRPWVMHTHGLIFHTESGLSVKHLAMKVYYGPLLRAGHAAIVASSEADRACLLRDVPALEARTATFENAIPLDALTSLPRVPEPGRIVTIGRVVRSKGIDDLLAALTLIRDVEWTLEIAGEADDAEVERLTSQASRDGLADRVRFRGTFADSELARLLQTASVAAFPSKGEGFGLALLEAMAAGVPVVARAIPAHEQLLGRDLDELLVDFGRPRDAADAIRSLLTSPAARSGALTIRLRKRAAGYDIARLHRQVNSLYRQLGLLKTI